MVLKATEEEVLQIARHLVSKPDNPLRGAPEFAVRDRVQRIGAKALEAALDERKQGGATVPA